MNASGKKKNADLINNFHTTHSQGHNIFYHYHKLLGLVARIYYSRKNKLLTSVYNVTKRRKSFILSKF